MSDIHFEKADLSHKDTIFRWLDEPHIREFWDNSQEHKDDILNFINKQKQYYFYGTTQYWLGYIDNKTFCFLLSDILLPDQELTESHRAHLSKTGNTIALDFGIGNKEFLGKGLAGPTLKSFCEFYQGNIDPHADCFFIDPDENNYRARQVYEKAGFQTVAEFVSDVGFFKDHKSLLMVKKMPSPLEFYL
ncbi:MAG: acetyltransferase [Alphaproteobacteria bacterium]|nr:acetyltransferase [Alphaproteobacteria bacterium]